MVVPVTVSKIRKFLLTRAVYDTTVYLELPFDLRNCIFYQMRWMGHVARMEEKRNEYRILVGKPEGKRPLGRPRCRWVDNIKMDLREIKWDGVDWIDVAQDRD
jgi:hypothetical protein